MPTDTSERVWVKLEGAVFEQGPDFELEKGWMSIQAAQDKLLTYGEQGLAVCVQGGGDAENSYCVLVPKGTSKFSDERFHSWVNKQPLPTAEEATLFEDDFAETEESGYDGDWARPGRGEGLGDEFQKLALFTGISPGDIHQGAIGDCWLVSSLAAMAEFPDTIEGMINPRKLALDGHYTVRLWSFANGSWQNYEVDDRLPSEGGRTPYVAITEDGEIWPCLLEKAFAVYSGGFPELQGGQPIFALGAMTGCTDLLSIMDAGGGATWQCCKVEPTTDRVHDLGGMAVSDTVDQAKLLAMLADFDQQNFVMCCGSHQGGSDAEVVDGIHLSHAYTLLTILPDCAGSGVNMMCLRNPHGRGEWDGDWSDESDLWDQNPAVAAACGHEVSDDGLFWMTFEDFCGHYSSISVCKKSLTQNRGKKTIKNIKHLNAAPNKDVVRAEMINPAMEKKRAYHASMCGGPCAEPCCIM